MKRLLILYIILWLMVSCTEEQKPAALPGLTLYAAKNITRDSAVLTGNILSESGTVVTSCHFVCVPSDDSGAEKRIFVSPSVGEVEATASELEAGKVYNYYLEVSNGISSVVSEPLSFTTYPNIKPVLGQLEIVGKGPISISAQCEILDDGGLPTKIGFRITKELTGMMNDVPGERISNELFTGKRSDLNPQSAYTLYAYASNTLGESRSNEISFETLNTVYISVAGTLKDQLEGEGRYTLPDLSVSGQLNGTDLRFIRDILGRDASGKETSGRLKRLNLYDAVIVEGGLSYVESRYTQNYTLGTDLFKDCIHLEELVLPSTLKIVEQDAFNGCSALHSIHLPADVTAFTASSGCTALTEITTSPLNTVFSSVDGVLYSKDREILQCYPEGKPGETFSIPPSVHSIGEYAFRNALISSIRIPHTIKELGAYSFYNSRLEYVVFSDAVETVPYAGFQSCTRLKQVQLGLSTLLLAEYCFDGCPLEDIYILADYPPVCRTNAFTPGIGIMENCVIHVLSGNKDLYRLSGSWKGFRTFVEDASSQ